MFDMDGNEASHGRDRVLPYLFSRMDSLTEDTVITPQLHAVNMQHGSIRNKLGCFYNNVFIDVVCICPEV